MPLGNHIEEWIREAHEFGTARRPLLLLRDVCFHDSPESDIRELLTSLALSHGMTISFSEVLNLAGDLEEWAILMWSQGP